ncbi:hypothetical protein D3C86_863830 [compost metagenome]
MARRPAAFEATVQDAVVTLCSGGRFDSDFFDRGVASCAHIRADVEIRQLAFEQEGNMRTDRMAIIENGDAMNGFDPFDFRRKRCVIGRVKGFQTVCDVVLSGLLPFIPDRLAVEIGLRNKPCCVLARIKADPGGVAVGVDHVPMKGGTHRRRFWDQIRIELVNMPVGIGQQFSVFVQALPDIRRHIRAGVG